ncbi:MAG: DUF58 domain-containing protein [Gammaproteobacteria bacterium]|nr:DUF58 domain-containing protein [Gammaproteobacteria bacterium]
MNTSGTVIDLDELLALRSAARDLRLRAVRRVYGGQSGGFLSPLRGRGLMYEETRVYQAGDDTRHIDWRVTARTERPHTKLYREERERPVWFVLDQSAYMHFGTRVAFKTVVAARLAAVLAWSARVQGDRVGAVVFNDQHLAWMTPLGGDRGVVHCLRMFAQARTQMPSNGLEDALQRTAHAARPGSLIYVMSDFNQWDAAQARSAQRLAKHCDVVLVRIFDPLEMTPPPAGLYGLSDGERTMLWDTRAATLAARYSAEFAARGQTLNKFCHRQRIAYVEQGTHLSINQALAVIATAHGALT